MDTEREFLNLLAAEGEYYDSSDDIPEDIIISTIKALERIIGDPARFPKADMDYIERKWVLFCSIAAGRLILI